MNFSLYAQNDLARGLIFSLCPASSTMHQSGNKNTATGVGNQWGWETTIFSREIISNPWGQQQYLRWLLCTTFLPRKQTAGYRTRSGKDLSPTWVMGMVCTPHSMSTMGWLMDCAVLCRYAQPRIFRQPHQKIPRKPLPSNGYRWAECIVFMPYLCQKSYTRSWNKVFNVLCSQAHPRFHHQNSFCRHVK